MKLPKVRGSSDFDMLLVLTLDNLGRCEESKIKDLGIELNILWGESESLRNVVGLSEDQKRGEEM